jgi:hypothetical protein
MHRGQTHQFLAPLRLVWSCAQAGRQDCGRLHGCKLFSMAPGLSLWPGPAPIQLGKRKLEWLASDLLPLLEAVRLMNISLSEAYQQQRKPRPAGPRFHPPAHSV